MATKLQIRRDTASNWTSANPTLSAGEFGFETDTYKLKIGDGSTAWTSLDYYDNQLAGGVDSAGIISLLGNGSVQHIIPSGNELYDLGDSNSRFRDLYLSGSSIKLGTATITADSAGTLTLPAGTQIGSGAVLDSANVLSLISASYIQSNQTTYNNNDFADSAFVTTQINNLIDGAPGTLNTLNEIAAALNDDDSAYGTLLGLINAKTDYDSADTLGLIDSAYIQARQSSVGSGGLDSATITNLIDSDYIQLRRPAETIMTVTGDGANYYFVGDGFPSTSSGDPTLYLTRGKTYRFEDISGSHPFEIRQSSGGSAYSTGVTNNGGSGTVIFTVPMDAPTSLVYQCTVHSGMVGDIVILDNTTGGGGLDSASVTNLIDSAYVQARQSAAGGVDSAATIALINNNTNSGFFRYKYSATAGQTAFQDSDLNGNVMSFDPNSTLVFYNGVLLNDSDDYTASSNTVTLTSGADAGSQVSVVKYGVGYVAPSYVWGGDRGVISGGYTASAISNIIDYYDITTTGNASDFGDMSSGAYQGSGLGDTTKALFNIGYNDATYVNTIDYVTVSTTGNASDFGDMVVAKSLRGAASDGTYGLWAGGNGGSTSMDYVTIASPGNASDFGDLSIVTYGLAGTSDTTYGLFAGGYTDTYVDTIHYVTIATPANASDFGDLTLARRYVAGLSDATRSVIASGNSASVSAETTIDYVTTATPGNATDFGDMAVGRQYAAGSGNDTYGTISGGRNSSNTATNSIDYFTIQTTGNASDFGDLTAARYGTAGASGNAS